MAQPIYFDNFGRALRAKAAAAPYEAGAQALQAVTQGASQAIVAYQQQKQADEDKKLPTLITIGDKFGYSQGMLGDINTIMQNKGIGSLSKNAQGEFQPPPPAVSQITAKYLQDNPEAMAGYMQTQLTGKSPQEWAMANRQQAISEQRLKLETDFKNMQMTTEALKQTQLKSKDTNYNAYSGWVLGKAGLAQKDYKDLVEGDRPLNYRELKIQSEVFSTENLNNQRDLEKRLKQIQIDEAQGKLKLETIRALGGSIAASVKALGKDHPVTRAMVESIAKLNGIDPALLPQTKQGWGDYLKSFILEVPAPSQGTQGSVRGQAVDAAGFVQSRITQGMSPADIFDQASQIEVSGKPGFKEAVAGALMHQQQQQGGVNFFGGGGK